MYTHCWNTCTYKNAYHWHPCVYTYLQKYIHFGVVSFVDPHGYWCQGHVRKPFKRDVEPSQLPFTCIVVELSLTRMSFFFSCQWAAHLGIVLGMGAQEKFNILSSSWLWKVLCHMQPVQLIMQWVQSAAWASTWRRCLCKGCPSRHHKKVCRRRAAARW